METIEAITLHMVLDVPNAIQIELKPKSASAILRERNLAIDIRKNGKPKGQFLNTYQLSAGMVIRHTRLIEDERIHVYHLELIPDEVHSVYNQLDPVDKRKLTRKLRSINK